MKSAIRHRRSEAGVTIVETMVAAGIAIAAIAGFSASVNQASRLARSGKAFASATAMTEERIESFRSTPTWSNVTTAAGIASVASAPSAIASNFAGVTETFTVQPYPSGSQLVVTRSPNGTFTNNGVNLSTSKCVKFTVAATWSAGGGATFSRQTSTVITKGGL
jgi:hypothetical protein